MKGRSGTPVPLTGADQVLTAGITSLGQDAAGELYLASPDMSVHRIVPAG